MTPTAAVLSVLTEVGALADLLTGFGLGTVFGTAILVAREHRGTRSRAAYIVGMSGLVGAVMGIAVNVVAELL